MSAGQEIDGATVSAAGLTVATKLQLNPSEVVEVTTVLPMEKSEPLAGEVVTVPHVPPSVGGSNVTAALVAPSAAMTVTLAGQVIVQTGVVVLVAVVVESELLLALPASAVSLATVAVLVRSEPLAMLPLTL